MKNSEYWKLRFKQLENSANAEASETLAFVDEQYKTAIKSIENEISTWYARFAKNNNISIQEARQFLSAKQLKELQWDVQEYIKYGKENSLDASWMKELENASAKFHISKLEALKMQTQMTCDKLFGSQLGSVTSLAKKTYLDGYYHSAYEIQKGMNIGWDISGIDENKLSKIINKPWTTDGKNFSDRIWANRQSLINETHKQLTQDILLGRSPDASINAISKKFNTSKQQAGRLVMTESAYFSSQSQKDCFNDLDVEQFEIVETLDSITCEICGSMDGQVYPMKEFEPGVTAPPFHPWCRGCTAPYFDDNFTERVAKDNDGKTYYVPSEMQYKEWEDKFINDGDKSDLDVYDENGVLHYVKHEEPEIIEPVPEVKPKKQYLTKKKLQANIADADVQIEDLENEFKNLSYGLSHEEVIKDYGSVEKFADDLYSDNVVNNSKMKDLYSQIEDIKTQKAEWQTKLNEKLVKEKKKVLLKQQIDLQQQLDDFEIKTYSGIWKDDVTTADWNKLNIEGKKKYYEGKFITETDPDKMKEFQDLYKQLDELDTEGKSYNQIQQELNKIQVDLTKLENSGIIQDEASDVFSQVRKDNAYWFSDKPSADAVLRSESGKVWINATSAQRSAAYRYTAGSGGFNRPLRGYDKSWYNFKGVGKVDLNNEGCEDAINHLVEIIDTSSYDFDIWLQRGIETTSGASSFLQISDSMLQNATQAELEQLLIGKVVKDEAFVSCGSCKGTGFSGYIFNIYAPKGTKMIYAEPFSHYGMGAKSNWDGISGQSYFGHEFETIIQRGTEFRITKVEKSGGNIYFDVEVVSQP